MFTRDPKSGHGALIAIVLLATNTASARPEFLQVARQTLRFRKGGLVERTSCSLCHASSGPPELNPFGEHLRRALPADGAGGLAPAILRSVLGGDSDGDGERDGEEIAADTLPGDPKSHSRKSAAKAPESSSPEGLFSLGSVLLARHAQHPVFVHFPIALFVVSLGLDLLAWAKRDPRLAWAGKLNLQIAASTSLLTIASGLLAWRLKFGAAPLAGVLLAHLIGGLFFAATVWAMLEIRRRWDVMNAWYFGAAVVGLLAVVTTGHLGGLLSGVAG